MEPRLYRNFCPSYRGFTSVPITMQLAYTADVNVYAPFETKKKLVKCHFLQHKHLYYKCKV